MWTSKEVRNAALDVRRHGAAIDVFDSEIAVGAKGFVASKASYSCER